MDTKKLRQKILDLAIHGKLVPQDPNDEPASVLLERIRKEKEQLIKEGKIKAPKKSKSAGDTSHYPKEGPWELPEGWVWTTIGELCTVFSAKRVHQSDWQKVGIPFYRAREIVKLSEHGYVDNDLFISEKLYNEFIGTGLIPGPGDIMISAVGTIGKTYIVRATDRFYFKDASVLCLRNPYLIPAYLDLYLQSTLARTQMHDGSKGTTVDTITIEKASDYLIPIPPLAEQERIVSYLDSILPILVSIESQKACIENLIDKTKQRILDLAIHGKLVSQDPTDEPAIELIKRMNPAFQPSHNLHYGTELPNGWQLCHIQDIASAELGKTLDRLKNTGEEKSYLCTLNVKWEAFDLSTIKTIRIEASEKERYAVRPGDLLVCEGGDVGRSAIWTEQGEIYYQNALHRIRFKTQDTCQEFFLYVLRNYKDRGIIDDVCKGVTIKHFTGQVLRSLDLPFPPVKEQVRIVKTVKAYYNVLDEIVAGLN